jgi:pyroglutamyl-peptidase
VADNAGHQAVDEPIVLDGPATYFMTLPVRAIGAVKVMAGSGLSLALAAEGRKPATAKPSVALL